MKFNKLKIKKLIYILIGIVLLLSIYLNTYLIVKNSILPLKYLIVYGIVVGLIPILLILYTIFKRRKSKLKVFFAIIEILYIIALFVVFFYLNKTFNFIEKFTEDYNYETKTYYVMVLNSSNYSKIEDINDKTMGYTEGFDESINNALEEINKKVNLNIEKADGYNELLEKLDNNTFDSIFMAQTNYDLLFNNESDGEITNTADKEKYKIIYEYSIKEEIKKEEDKVDVTEHPFNIYISGIDTYGSITNKTRSDVNIVMNVNPKTNKILLITIPRDYYVELAGVGQKDKLTHAGIYGVEMSMKTIENLLDTKINYYMKVNYNALIKLVDTLEGVDVYSEYTFNTVGTGHNFHFEKGYNHVDGIHALEFARTRQAFQYGDRVRGENQQRVIEAIFKKMCNASVLMKYDKILGSLEGNFATNLSTEKINKLINMQLDKMPSWDINSMSLNGSDGHGYTYSYSGQELYVMIPDEETVKAAQEAIKTNSGLNTNKTQDEENNSN